jgi:hypothetical protein
MDHSCGSIIKHNLSVFGAIYSYPRLCYQDDIQLFIVILVEGR